MYRWLAVLFFVSLPLIALGQDLNAPAVEVLSPVAGTCVNGGTGNPCQTTADCLEPGVGGTGQTCDTSDDCNRTGVPCGAAADCEAAGAGTACNNGECFFEGQVCSDDGRCFDACQTAADCGEGAGHVCSENRCYFTDQICRNNRCATENGLVGGDAAPDPSDVKMNIRLSDPRSRDLKLQFEAAWTSPAPSGRVCPNNRDDECEDSRLECQAGACQPRGCVVDDDCNDCQNGSCVGNLVCAQATNGGVLQCAKKGFHSFQVGYAFPATCQPGQPCVADTDQFEFLGFLIGDSPAAEITVKVKEACDEIPPSSGACTSCLTDQECGLGRGCYDGACVNLAGPQGRCGAGFRACNGDEVCLDGICFADEQRECQQAVDCLPLGAPAGDAANYACLRGRCIDTTNDTLSPSGFAIEVPCEANERCIANRCLPQETCATFDNVESSVTFRLDRKSPTVTLNSNALEQALAECTDSPSSIVDAISVNDDQTSQPTVVALADELVGCTVRRIVRVSDDCGNGNTQDIALLSSKPVEAGQLGVTVTAYRCDPGEDCVTEGEGVQMVGENERIPSGTAVVRIDAEQGCALTSTSTIINEDYYNGACPASPPQPEGDGFCAQCQTDDECGIGAACYEGVCIDLNRGSGACGPNLQACANGSECVDGVCLVGGQPQCVDSAQCGANGACVRGVCIDELTDLPCGANEICRDGSCVDPQPDVQCAGGCPGGQVCLQGSCFEPEECTANVDCLGSRYCSEGECVSPCQTYAGERLTKAGRYTIKATAEGCGDGVAASDEVTFEILEAPLPRLSGPGFMNGVYRVQQGQPLTLDASMTLAGSAIVEFAWDVNRDGFFDPGPGANPCAGNADCRGDEICHEDGLCRLLCDSDSDCRQNSDPAQVCSVDEGFCRTEVFSGNQPRYSFNTDDSGTHRVRLRVTDEYGAVGHLNFDVEVTDVEPICDLGGPYEVAEGTPLAFVTDGIREGHPSDPIVYYGWDFGDGRQNTGRNQNHIFDIDPNFPPPNDTYTVTLSLRDLDSPLDSPTTCQTTVKVLDVDPVVSAIDVLNPQQQVEGQVVQFDGSARAGGARDPLSTFRWTATCIEGRCADPDSRFVDRTQQGEQMSRMDWSFPEDGRYRICLEVSDEDSTGAELCREVVIADVSPIATITGPASADQGDELAFNLTGTIGGDPDDTLNRVIINWGDGSGNEVRTRLALESTNYTVMHTYVQDGEKTVTIRAIDEDSQAVASHTVLIRDAKPSAVITGPTEAVEGQEIELSALNSLPGSEQDPIVEYRWDFGDGQTVVKPAGQQVVRHAFPDDRTYIVRMTVVDIDGSEVTATHEVVVENKPPQVTLVPPGGMTQVALGETIQFVVQSKDAPVPNDDMVRVIALVDDVAADLPPNQAIRVSWNLDDGGAPKPGAIVEASYNTLGRKEITVEIEDGDVGGRARCRGADGTYDEQNCTYVVQVTPAPPVIIAESEVTAVEGRELEFTAKVTAPLVGEGRYGELDVRTEGNLPGARIVIGELETPDEGAPFKIVTVKWTPSYYEAPIIRPFQVTAFANETSRSKTVSIRVVDGGSPRLVTLGGRANLSQLTFYDYGIDPQSRQLRLTPNAPISLGLGVGALAAGPEQRYVWVTVPGSNAVAVVDAQAGGRGLVRRVPVGERPSAIAVGGRSLADGPKIWVANQGDNTISVIDPESMKLDYRTAEGNYRSSFNLEGIDGPSDMVWLPAGFGGLEDSRLAIITRYSGHIALVDPEKVVNGELRPVTARVQIGAVLNRIVADPVSGDLFVSDVKTRRIYRINALDLETNDNPRINGLSVPTAVRDLVVNVITDEQSGDQTSTVIAALEDGLLEIDGDDVEDYINTVSALAAVSGEAVTGGAIATMSPGGILRHAQPADIQNSVPRPSSVPTGDRLVRRMLVLISPR